MSTYFTKHPKTVDGVVHVVENVERSDVWGTFMCGMTYTTDPDIPKDSHYGYKWVDEAIGQAPTCISCFLCKIGLEISDDS